MKIIRKWLYRLATFAARSLYRSSRMLWSAYRGLCQKVVLKQRCELSRTDSLAPVGIAARLLTTPIPEEWFQGESQESLKPKTFRVNHLVLFLDEQKHHHLKQYVDEALQGTVGRHFISVLYRDNHKALIHSYKIKQTPTLLIFNKEVDEIARITDEELLTVPFFRKALFLAGYETSVRL